MSEPLRTLYPEAVIHFSGMLQVSRNHSIHIEESGNSEGVPVIVLHGGPGVGAYPQLHRFFDPAVYRVITFDQRGSGKSTPYASLEDNTTWDLVGDIEKIRGLLGVDSWLVFGGSWGSTLALTYAMLHPERVKGLILRGIFLGTQREIDWLYRDGASRVFPEFWEDFIAPIPEAERGDLLAAYHRRLSCGDEKLCMTAAINWARWEDRTLALRPSAKEELTDSKIALSIARIETHYFVNHCFFPDRDCYLLSEQKIARIADIPGVIVQGRYDMICPMEAAWALHKAWPSSKLYVSPDAGHAAGEATNTHHLIEATDGFHQLFP